MPAAFPVGGPASGFGPVGKAALEALGDAGKRLLLGALEDVGQAEG